jgi:pilus assembly protein CpaB
MQKHRVLFAFGVAWLSALLLSWWVYKKTTAPQTRQLVQAVAAAKDLPVGQRLAAADLKMITVERKDLPKGVFLKIGDVAERAVTAPITANELVLEREVAAKGSGEGMTSLIERGMRAVSVQVNEISGVSGFIQPGTRVDVIYTRIFPNGDAATTTVLQNIKVIAYGKQLEAGAKLDPREAAKVTVATLLVTQEQAEKLALAVQRGRIQLVLRNPLDEEIAPDTDPVGSADLGIEDPKKEPPPRPVAAAPPVVIAPKPSTPSGPVEQRVKADNDGHVVVHVYRGSKVSEDVFE